MLDVIGGNLFLDSANSFLNIDLLNDFNPVGHTYAIMTDTGGTISGMFQNAQGSFQMDGYNWTIAYNTNSIILNAISPVAAPLPGSLWLLLSGLAGLGGLRRFRRS